MQLYNKTIKYVTKFTLVLNKNVRERSPNWPQIPDLIYRLLIIRGSGSGNTHALFNLINHQLDDNKIHLYAKDCYGEKYNLLITKRENTALHQFNDSNRILLNTHMIWVIFIKILKNKIQVKNK